MLRWSGALFCSWAVFLAGCLDQGDEVASSSAAVAVTWTNAVGVSAVGNDLTKTSGTTGWNAGAVSVETVLGDGYVQFTTGEANTSKMAGLSMGDNGQGRADIDFAIHLKPNGTVGVYETGVLRGGNFTSYAAGDLLRVEAKAGVVRYSKNGAVFYTSAVAPGSPLLVNTSLNTPGATLLDVELVSTSIHWQNLIAVAAAGDDLTKTGTDAAWTAGASSVETLTGDGFVEFTATEATTLRMAGLGNGDSSAHFSDIEYGIRLKANGVVGIYESGVERVLNAGTYLSGDTFRVEVSGGVVTYSMNGGPPFYTSQVAPTFPLRVDTSFHTPGAPLTDVRLVEDAAACPAYHGNGPVCGGTFVVNNTFDLDQIDECAEITGDLTIDAPGLAVIALPALERVGGDFSVTGNGGLERLRFPALKEIGGTLFATAFPASADVNLSRLKSAGVNFLDSPALAAGLPCLETARDLYATNPWIPRLRSASGTVAGVVAAPALEVAGGIGGEVTAPILTTVTGTLHADSIDAPSLTEVGGTLYYGTDIDVPAVQRAGDLFIESTATTINLPALIEVTGMVTGAGPSLSVFELAALETAGSIELSWGQLAQVLLPSLRTVTGEGPGKLGLSIDLQTGGGSIALPALESITGDLVVLDDSSFPVLGLVAGKLSLYDAMSAPLLAEIRGHVFVDASITTVSFPSLLSAYSLRFGTVRSYVQTIDLPALTTLSGGGGATAGTFRVNHPLDLVTLSLPSLESTSGSFSITEGNVLSTLDVPSLVSVGPSFTVSDNPVLPTCQAQAVVDQLLANGWTGTINISGNDDGGTCP